MTGYRGTVADINRQRQAAGLPAIPDGFGWGPAPPARVVVTEPAPVELPLGQKMALLLLRRGELAHQILAHAREWGAQHVRADWDALLDPRINYAVKRKGRIELTPSGLHAAQAVCRDLAKKLGIHDITRRHASGHHGPSAQCTCGFNCYSHAGRAGESNVTGMVSHHLRQVRDGTLPVAYRHGGERQ